MPTLRAIGYWRSDDPQAPPDLPEPQSLVHVSLGGELQLVWTYLRSGAVLNRWRGFSWCRFGCGIDEERMGWRCLTDGRWVWPEGLAHYVERHGVGLPEEFVRWARQGGWHINETLTSKVCREIEPGYDYSYWTEWATLEARRR